MINPGEIPQIPGNMEALTGHANSVKTVGTNFAATGQAVDTTWQGLAPHYKAPEAGQLFAATGPVRTTSASVGEDLQAVGAALATYASEVKEIKAQLASLKVQAEQFNSSIDGDDDWRDDEGKVNKHNGLISAVNTQVAAFFEAQRKCANTINALYGGKQYRADNLDGKAEDGEYGFTADALNAAAGEDGALPWGSNEEHDRGFLGDVGAFFGGIGEGFVTMLEDLGSLIGRDPETGEWSWGTAGNAWLGMGKFVWALGIYSNPVTIVLDHTTGIPGWEKHGAGNLLLNAGKSIIAYDTWGEDKSKAAGMATFNIVSAVVGTKGAGGALRGTGAAVNGIRNSATAARVSGALIRAGNWLDNLPTVPEVATNFAKKFNIEIPNFNGLVPEFAGGRPGGGGFHFDVEMPNDRGGGPMHMDGGNGSGNGSGNGNGFGDGNGNGSGNGNGNGDGNGSGNGNGDGNGSGNGNGAGDGNGNGDGNGDGNGAGDNTPTDYTPGNDTPDNTPGDSTPGDPNGGDSTPNDSADGDNGSSSSRPEWLRELLDGGNEFNARREPYYEEQGGANEVHVEPKSDKGQYPRVDSYIPGEEIVSRKNTQLSDVKPETVYKYLDEFIKKYKEGTIIADTPTNRRDLGDDQIGKPLEGEMILEVPEQVKDVPPEIIKRADELGITIRDENGKEYKLDDEYRSGPADDADGEPGDGDASGDEGGPDAE